MNNTDQILLGLLRRALFARPFSFPVAETDWEALFREASAHTVQLLIYDCLTREERAAAPAETMCRWQAAALRILQKNEQLTREQTRILRAFREKDLSCAVIKGSMCAKNYPRVELRCAGDIDILIGREDCGQAESILLEMGYALSGERCPWHIALRRGTAVIELHFEPAGLPDGKVGAKLREYFRAALPLTVCHEAVVLLLHKLNHIRSGGLGLRQLCDWALFVRTQISTDVWQELEPLLRQFGLLRFAKTVTLLCVEHLGLDAQDARWCMDADKTLAEKLLEDILRTGNFGCKENRYGQYLFTDGGPGGRLASMWRVGVKAGRKEWPVCRRCPILLPAAPVVLLVRHAVRRRRGEVPALRLYANFREAGARQSLYRQLHPFQPEA